MTLLNSIFFKWFSKKERKKERKKIAHCVLRNLYYIIFICIELDKNFEFFHKMVRKNQMKLLPNPI